MGVAMATTPSTVPTTFFLRFSATQTFPTKSKFSSINACKNLTSILTAKNLSGHIKNPISSCTSTSIVCFAAASGEENNAEVGDEGEKGGEENNAKEVEGLKLMSEADFLKKKAKKAMQRRKRLLRKRKLRKKGRWPPSKMAKLKNV